VTGCDGIFPKLFLWCHMRTFRENPSKPVTRANPSPGARVRIETRAGTRARQTTCGPRDCLRTRQAPADCPPCGAAGVTVRHTPMRRAGTGCANCCPCCAPAGGGARMPQERAGGAVARPDRPRASYHGGKGGRCAAVPVCVPVRPRASWSVPANGHAAAQLRAVSTQYARVARTRVMESFRRNRTG